MERNEWNTTVYRVRVPLSCLSVIAYRRTTIVRIRRASFSIQCQCITNGPESAWCRNHPIQTHTHTHSLSRIQRIHMLDLFSFISLWCFCYCWRVFYLYKMHFFLSFFVPFLVVVDFFSAIHFVGWLARDPRSYMQHAHSADEQRR